MHYLETGNLYIMQNFTLFKIPTEYKKWNVIFYAFLDKFTCVLGGSSPCL